MSHVVNQVKAALTISKYSLLATLKSLTSVVFALLFPIIFITVFGSVNVGKPPVMKLAIASGSDTANIMFKALRSIPSISLQVGLSPAGQSESIKKGRLAGIVSISTDNSVPFAPPLYTIHLQQGPSADTVMLQTMLHEFVRRIDKKVYPDNPSIANLSVTQLPGRVYRSIDFILPGQLGFSILMAGVYGSSFLLFSLRQGLVLKRLRTTPVSRGAIIGGEMLSRLFFQVISFIIMVTLGYYVFHFTLVNGIATFAEMLIFSLLGLGIFMGIGFIVSGLVQNENAITPIANTIVLPQILLCGLFFPIANYPHWMQVFCNALPLTIFVEGLRKIAFEGTHMWQMPNTIAGLFLWTLIIIPVSVRSFRWE